MRNNGRRTAKGCRVFLTSLGKVTVWSISICVLTVLFGLTSPAGLVQAWRARHWAIRRGVWIHSLLVAAACTATAIYLASWGLIGLRTWG